MSLLIHLKGYSLLTDTRTHTRTHAPFHHLVGARAVFIFSSSAGSPCRVSVPRQEDVPHHPGLLLRGGPGLQVHRADGHRPGGQQALPLRLSPLLVAGGRQGRPSAARQVGSTCRYTCRYTRRYTWNSRDTALQELEFHHHRDRKRSVRSTPKPPKLKANISLLASPRTGSQSRTSPS